VNIQTIEAFSKCFPLTAGFKIQEGENLKFPFIKGGFFDWIQPDFDGSLTDEGWYWYLRKAYAAMKPSLMARIPLTFNQMSDNNAEKRPLFLQG
jgi:hypothetical protein